MPLSPTPCERYLGGFYVEEDEHYDAIYRGRCARYIIVLDSYADAVAWRRLMTADNSFIIPLSQAAGEAASQIREAVALADAQAEATRDAESGEGESDVEASEIEPLDEPEGDPLDIALTHLRALLTRHPSYTDYNELFVPVEKCAYCEAELTDGRHDPDCVWQAANRFLFETVIEA